MSTNDTVTAQLTSQDLEALVNIQAELERIGSEIPPSHEETVVTTEVELEEVLRNASPEPASSSSTFKVVNSEVCTVLEDVVVESQTSPVTTPIPTPEPVIEPTSVGVSTLNASAPTTTPITITLPSKVSLPAKVMVNNIQDTTGATAPLVTKEVTIPASENVKVSAKPYYLIPNRSGGMTVTSIAPKLGQLSTESGVPTKFVVAAAGNSGVGGGTMTGKSIMLPKAVLDAAAKGQLLKGPVTSVVNSTSSGGQVITKVIIATSALTANSPTQTFTFAPGTPLTATMASTGSIAGMSQPVKIVATTQAQSVAGVQGKTLTLAQLPTQATGSPVKSQIITALPPTPQKQTIMVSKIALSSKTPTKITMIPVLGKSPQKIAPAPQSITGTQVVSKSSLLTSVAMGASTTTLTTTTVPKVGPSTILSPSKLIIKQQPASQTVTLKQGTITSTGNQIGAVGVNQLAVATSTGVQPIQVPGSKFSYIRLVPASAATTSTVSSSGGALTRPIAPATLSSAAPTAQPQQVQATAATPSQVKIAVPITAAPGQLIGQPKVAPKQLPGQRILIPASSVGGVTQIRATTGGIANAFSNLPPGTTLFSPGGNLGNIVMLPAQYVTQFQSQLSQSQSSTGGTTAPKTVVASTNDSSTVAVLPASTGTTQYSNAPTPSSSSSGSVQEQRNSSHTNAKHQLNGSTLDPDGVRPRKPCNCTKSQCLKLYCDCFANGEFCHNCNCNNCANNLEREEERQKAIKACLERNPQAFHPKIGKSRDGEVERRHNKGCNCKRSGCLKNYCECYEAKIMCSYMCKCVGCKNFAESAEKKTLMHLADAAEVRVQQQTAAKSKLSSQMQDVPIKPAMGSASGERLPSTFITSEVIEATTQCLLAQADEGRDKNQSESVVEKLVMQEFGRCLIQIIDYASKTKINRDSSRTGGLAELENGLASE